MSFWISEVVCVGSGPWSSVCHLVLYRRRRRPIGSPWGRWAPVSTARRIGKAGRWVKRWLSGRNPTPPSHWAARAGPTGLQTEEAQTVRGYKLSTSIVLGLDWERDSSQIQREKKKWCPPVFVFTMIGFNVTKKCFCMTVQSTRQFETVYGTTVAILAGSTSSSTLLHWQDFRYLITFVCNSKESDHWKGKYK